MRDALQWISPLVMLLGAASMWGSTRETLKRLESAVEKLAAEIKLLTALERAHALLQQELTHLSQRLATAEAEQQRQRDRTHDLADALSETRAEMSLASKPPRQSPR